MTRERRITIVSVPLERWLPTVFRDAKRRWTKKIMLAKRQRREKGAKKKENKKRKLRFGLAQAILRPPLYIYRGQE